ncbi:M15 family metallopeptidase [Fundicoccus culcitae]|uniref:M15 family metallopeptidase n=1 Tax=Fundicoccus culcitae TaxID=2969821 RepID=A0ABY5P365_9LACT|nr:M15 family metallopeptidase [Fundicoccus culcitae]UUX33031.1 M15 family metallopeptidase [Fundicoccus culcitae]
MTKRLSKLGILGFLIMLILPLQSLKVQANAYIQPTTLDLIVATKSGASLQELLEDLPENATSSDPNLMLINALHPIESDLWMDFAYTDKGEMFDSAISGYYYQMINDAAAQGIYYDVVSAYRTIEEQTYNRTVRINAYLAEGYSQADAINLTDRYYAPANASEHNTGLVFDLLGYDWVNIGGGLSADYAYQYSAVWLAENAYQYGFILRYPEGKTHLTGYYFEPWHYRYVGYEHAEYMFRHGLVLEEYLLLLQTREALN